MGATCIAAALVAAIEAAEPGRPYTPRIALYDDATVIGMIDDDLYASRAAREVVDRVAVAAAAVANAPMKPFIFAGHVPDGPNYRITSRRGSDSSTVVVVGILESHHSPFDREAELARADLPRELRGLVELLLAVPLAAKDRVTPPGSSALFVQTLRGPSCSAPPHLVLFTARDKIKADVPGPAGYLVDEPGILWREFQLWSKECPSRVIEIDRRRYALSVGAPVTTLRPH